MRQFLILLFILSINSIKAQYFISDIPKDGFLKDFDISVEILKKQHPNIYRFISENDFNKKIDSLRKNIEKRPSYENFLLNLPNKIIGDGHTGFYPYSNYESDLMSKLNLFPINLISENGKIYVNDKNNYGIETGSKIISINDINIEDITKAIPSSHDGKINVDRQNIDLFIPFVYDSKKYTIKYLDTKEQIKIVTVPSVNYVYKTYLQRKSIIPINSTNIYGYYIDDNTYYLCIKTFRISESQLYDELNKYFSLIKNNSKINNLVLDIRGNTGGSISNVPLLYSFISKTSFFQNNYKYGTKVKDIRYKDFLISDDGRLLSEIDIREIDNYMNQRFDKSTNSDYYFGNNRFDESYVSNYPRNSLFYDKDVYLLIDNNTFSAATYFASLFQKEKRGEIIGKETGTCKNFTTAFMFLSYKLPNTKTILSIPRIEIFYNASNNTDFKNIFKNIKDCTGVIPNKKVNEKFFLKNLINEQDPELNMVIDIIKTKKRTF